MRKGKSALQISYDIRAKLCEAEEKKVARVIAFSNQKGGVGKTTTCVNFSAYLAEMGKKVLLVDLDPQGNATTGLGVAKEQIDCSVYDVLTQPVPMKGIVKTTPVEKLRLAPADINLAGAELELASLPEREKKLAGAIAEVKKDYDFITVDCPPSLGLLTINALTAADGVMIPIQAEFYALEGLTQLMNSFKLVKKYGLNTHLEIEGAVLTMYDGRSLMARDVREQIEKYFGQPLFQTVIPRNVRLVEAPSHGVPVLLHDDTCAGAQAYRALAEEYLHRRSRAEREEGGKPL